MDAGSIVGIGKEGRENDDNVAEKLFERKIDGGTEGRLGCSGTMLHFSNSSTTLHLFLQPDTVG